MKKSVSEQCARNVVVIDFETTGLSPAEGHRVIEVGAVLIKNGSIVDRFQQLMNPGVRVSAFIESYTGITNQMLKKAPSCGTVMQQLAEFLGTHNLVAHNAAFDQRFLEAEMRAIRQHVRGQFACSMLVSRRLYPTAPNHKLESLINFKKIANDGVFHRALADAELTAQLWLRMIEDMQDRYPGLSPSFDLMQRLSRQPVSGAEHYLAEYSAAAAC